MLVRGDPGQICMFRALWSVSMLRKDEVGKGKAARSLEGPLQQSWGRWQKLGVNESRKSGGKIRIRVHRVLCFRKDEKEVTPPPSATPNNPWQSLRTPNNHACC